MSRVPALTAPRLRTFVSQIAKSGGADGCWIWTGAKNSSGHASGVKGPAYRIAYEWMVGPIPEGMQLDHLCRRKDCVNPHHLEPVTRAENQRRVRVAGPFKPVSYCRNGHALAAENARLWSNGKGKIETRCYICHEGKPARRAA